MTKTTKTDTNENAALRNLAEIRRDISRTDDEMARLFEKRMELVAQVAEYKRANSLPIYDAEREAQVLQSGAERIDNPDLKSYYFGFQKNLMELSRKYQSRKALLRISRR